MVLVGLMATKGSGKSTAANHMVKNYDFIEASMAEPLKKACQELFLFTDEQVFGTQQQKETPDLRWFGCTPRSALQYVGTDLLRENMEKIMPGLQKNIFTHRFKLWYEQELAKNPNLRVVVSDIRFQNEADFIHSLGGVVVKINRPSETTSDVHSSEVELQNIKSYDLLIENKSTLEDFHDQLDIFVTCGLKISRPLRFFLVDMVSDVLTYIPIIGYVILKYNWLRLI